MTEMPYLKQMNLSQGKLTVGRIANPFMLSLVWDMGNTVKMFGLAWGFLVRKVAINENIYHYRNDYRNDYNY